MELVRTVLEHQARREDQHCQQLSILLMQIASAPPRDVYLSTTSLASNAKPLPQPAEGAEANGRRGTIARTLHRLIPALRR